MTRFVMPSRRRFAALASYLALVVTACKQETPTAAPLLPVHTAEVQSISAYSGTKYSANIVPYAQVDLSFKSNGYVERIHQVKNPSGGIRNVDQGDRIAQGTVLAVVSQQDYIDKLQQT